MHRGAPLTGVSCPASRLERQRRPWRLAFTSPSLGGLWAAAASGFGITIRTRLGLPQQLAALGKASGLPKLPEIGLSLYAAAATPKPVVTRLREILLEELSAVIAAASR